jgi:hypothetical protein
MSRMSIRLHHREGKAISGLDILRVSIAQQVKGRRRSGILRWHGSSS